LMKVAGAIDADEKFDWTKGAPQNSPLPEHVATFLNQTVFPYYFKLLEQEDDKEVIESVLERLREIAEAFGPASIGARVEELVPVLIRFLEKKAFCQTKMMVDENEGDLEDCDDDEEDEDE